MLDDIFCKWLKFFDVKASVLNILVLMGDY